MKESSIELANKLNMYINYNYERCAKVIIGRSKKKSLETVIDKLGKISINAYKNINDVAKETISYLTVKEYAQICALICLLEEYQISDADLLRVLKHVKDCKVYYEALKAYPTECYSSLAKYVEKTQTIMVCISQNRERKNNGDDIETDNL